VPARLDYHKEEPKHGSDSERFNVTIPGDAKAPSFPRMLFLPFPPPLVRCGANVVWSSYRFTIEKAGWNLCRQLRRASQPIRSILFPAVTLTVEPQQEWFQYNARLSRVKLLARIRYQRNKTRKG